MKEIEIFGFKFRLVNILCIAIIGLLIAVFTTWSCATCTLTECVKIFKDSSIIVKESFVKISDIASTSSEINDVVGGDVKDSWSNKALTYAGGMGHETVLAKHVNYKSTKIPLEGTMDFFKNTLFKPECCPSTFSTSTGCACTSVDQLNYLNQRGGNRTQPSQF